MYRAVAAADLATVEPTPPTALNQRKKSDHARQNRPAGFVGDMAERDRAAAAPLSPPINISAAGSVRRASASCTTQRIHLSASWLTNDNCHYIGSSDDSPLSTSWSENPLRQRRPPWRQRGACRKDGSRAGPARRCNAAGTAQLARLWSSPARRRPRGILERRPSR